MNTFIGDYLVKVDEKGRTVLPVAFKKQLPPAAEDRFVIKKDIFEKCLVLYTMEEWERQNELIRKSINPYKKNHNRFLREFYKGTVEVILDKSNRFLIPKRLLELAEIDKDIYITGMDNKIEIWAKELYEKLGNDDESFALLAEEIFSEQTET